MKVVVKCASGPLDLDVSDSATVSDLLKMAMEKHKCPPWADGVQLQLEGSSEDLAEDGLKSLASVGVSGGATLKMAYYQDVLPVEAKRLKAMGISPGAGGFLAGKA
uniref:Ubiquitin-like domain-containing protein n=1 Tax=Alexandrium andersonii TaxID=327968 RepID=A0A7S2MD92_9DINO|mmetsp:Transcript_65927/g.147931  ORF Transcript_65927/g.147931 Transcript_65927/m.147931 type:complete len:106 (+) Transcript_65927:104-421(+)